MLVHGLLSCTHDSHEANEAPRLCRAPTAGGADSWPFSPPPAPPAQSPQLLTIPQFYFPQPGPQPEAQRSMEDGLMALLAAQPAGLLVEDLKRMLQQVGSAAAPARAASRAAPAQRASPAGAAGSAAGSARASRAPVVRLPSRLACLLPACGRRPACPPPAEQPRLEHGLGLRGADTEPAIQPSLPSLPQAGNKGGGAGGARCPAAVGLGP